MQDLLILATDTESLHPDIDTDIVLSTDFAEIHPWLVVWHGNEVPVLQYLPDHNYVCYKEGHEHWCVGGQRAIAAGMTEFCGCQHIYAGCQAFPADPAATPPPTPLMRAPTGRTTAGPLLANVLCAVTSTAPQVGTTPVTRAWAW